MSKILIVAHLLNGLLIAILVLATFGFVSFGNLYGLFLALVSSLIAFGVYKRNRWAYFSAAAWGLACYQLAKQGYEFQSIKRYAMVIGIFLVPVALFLHEVLAKKLQQNAQNHSSDSNDKNSMPD
jgi:hypothetical protein